MKLYVSQTSFCLAGIQTWRHHWMFCQEQHHLFMRVKKRVSFLTTLCCVMCLCVSESGLVELRDMFPPPSSFLGFNMVDCGFIVCMIRAVLDIH